MNWPGFTNPWLLAGLAAVGVPVLIHFLTRARPRKIEFPPYQFLLEACAGQQAVHRLRTIVVLTIRSLLVLVLALLFARPFLKPTGADGNVTAASRVVLVLDASLSMRAVQRGVPLFARAQAEAADVLRALPVNSEAAVVLVGATPRAVLPALSRNLPALHEALVAARPTCEMGDPAAALTVAKQLLGEGAGTIYVFSDFQQSNWGSGTELPAGVTCRLRPVTTEPVDNVALTALRLAPAAPVVGEAAEVVATVFNGTARPREETVRLALGDVTQERRVTIAPFGTADTAFTVNFPAAGFFTGRAMLRADDLGEDNVRYLAVRVQRALQILLVSDSDAGDRRSGAFFLQRALVPSPQAAPGLSIVRRHGQDTDRGVLETSDLFVLVAPATLTGEAGEIIARRVQEGAALIVFLDGPTAPSLAAANFGAPFQLLRAVVSDTGDPLVAGSRTVVADTDATDWATLRFRCHFQTRLFEGRQEDVFLTYPDGAAALSLSAVGKGAAVFANLPLTPDAGDWIGHPLFPSLLHELVRALRRGVGEQAATPGRAWTLEVPSVSDAAVAVTDPADKPVPVQVLSSGRTARLAVPAVGEPGLYLLRQVGKVIGAGVVNVDPRESDTRPVALENLKSGAGTRVSVLRREQELTLAGQERPLWPQLAVCAAGLIALELLVLALWRTRAEARR
jgi:hypothetical protein